MLQHAKINQYNIHCNYRITQLQRGKNTHIINPINAEKAFDKNYTPFQEKNHSKNQVLKDTTSTK